MVYHLLLDFFPGYLCERLFRDEVKPANSCVSPGIVMVLMGYVDMANKSLYVALTFVAVERTPITGLLAVAQLFGYINGLVRLYLMLEIMLIVLPQGFSVLTFDWSQIAYVLYVFVALIFTEYRV